MESTRINVMEISSIDPQKATPLNKYSYKKKFLFRKEGFYREGYLVNDEIGVKGIHATKENKVYRLARIIITMNNGVRHTKTFDSNVEMSKYLKSSRFKHLTLLEL